MSGNSFGSGCTGSLLAAALLLAAGISSCTPAPESHGPVPTEAQLAWQRMETYAFIHFGPNTFLDREWGYGDADPAVFNPSQLDCRQWARTCRDAGLKGIILTAKHHDGFCLWPSRYTEYSVRNSPWREGRGDLVRELSDACREYGLRFGVYLSPWDRNRADYGTPAYLDYYRAQLKELLTGYGPVFELWFDGANGGDGWYGGADEVRNVDRKTYYSWEETRRMAYGIQPDIIVFSDGGPGCRWCGNERGEAGRTNWSLLRADEVWAGYPRTDELNTGHPDGTHWVPAEADVSIRPGWFYHEREDSLVKTAEQLAGLYYRSVGRNATLLLNLPVDRRGLIPAVDSARLMEARRMLEQHFAVDLAAGRPASADSERGRKYRAGRTTDGDPESFWAPAAGQTAGEVVLELGRKPVAFDCILLQEPVALGQRISAFAVDVRQDDGSWRTVAEETTVGYKRILQIPETVSTAVRLRILESAADPLVSRISVYHTQARTNRTTSR